MWSVWSDWLVVCDCSFSLSALWSPLSVPTILLGFLLPWTWGLSSNFIIRHHWISHVREAHRRTEIQRRNDSFTPVIKKSARGAAFQLGLQKRIRFLQSLSVREGFSGWRNMVMGSWTWECAQGMSSCFIRLNRSVWVMSLGKWD